MRIGDLAKRAGTTMRTIRYYEERGLIEPARRTKGGFRLYQEEELRKLHLIRSLQVLDMPLAQVKAFFDERQRGRTAAEIAPAPAGVPVYRGLPLSTYLDKLKSASEADRPDVPLVVLTLDPWRDTPDRLPMMAHHWGLSSNDRALSGSVSDVQRTLDLLGIGRRRDDATGDIVHGTTTMIVNDHGRIAWRIDGGWNGVAALLRRLPRPEPSIAVPTP